MGRPGNQEGDAMFTIEIYFMDGLTGWADPVS